MEHYLDDCIKCYKTAFKKTFKSAESVIYHLYKNNRLGVYTKRNKVVGIFSIDQYGLISDFCVHKVYEGQGYGKRILNLIENNPNHDIKNLKLKVWVHNKRAVFLYIGMGFNIVKSIPYRDKIILFLEKNITKKDCVLLEDEHFFFPEI